MSNEENRILNTTWLLVILAWLGYMLVNLGNFALGIMLPSIRQELNFGIEASGWLSASGWIIKAVLTIPITLAITKFKPKHVLTSVFFIASLGLVLQSITTNFALLMIGRSAVMGISGAILAPLAAIKFNLIPKDKLQQLNGIEAFTGPAGQVMGTALVPILLVSLSGWRNVTLLLGILGLILTVLWAISTRKLVEEDAAKNKVDTTISENPLKEALKHKAVWLLALGWPGTSLVWIATYTFWPTFAVENLGITLAQSGTILGILPIGSMVGALTGPGLAKKIGYDKLMIWPWGFILPFAYFTLLITNNIALLTLAAFIAGYGAYAFIPIAFTTIYKIPGISPKGVSMGLAMIFTFVGVGGALGGTIAGILGQSLGLYKAMALCCLSPLLFGVLTFFLPEYGRKHVEKLQEKNS